MLKKILKKIIYFQRVAPTTVNISTRRVDYFGTRESGIGNGISTISLSLFFSFPRPLNDPTHKQCSSSLLYFTKLWGRERVQQTTTLNTQRGRERERERDEEAINAELNYPFLGQYLFHSHIPQKR